MAVSGGFLVLSGCVWWCLVVFGGVWWCLVVSGECLEGVWGLSGGYIGVWVISELCLAVSGGCLVVSGCVWWCLVVVGGVWWCLGCVWMVSEACLGGISGSG